MADKIFEMYKELKNERGNNKELKVKEEEFKDLDAITDNLSKFLFSIGDDIEKGGAEIGNNYQIVKGFFMYGGEWSYNIKTIEEFCRRLKEFEKEKYFDYAGLYISALINAIAKDKDIIWLDFSKLEKKIDFIGADIDKDIIINVRGSVGHYLGIWMKKGKIIIEEGDVGNRIGHDMSGGEIEFYRDYGSIAINFHNGKIYHQDRLIMSK